MDIKICYGCKITQPLSEFRIDRGSRLRDCRICINKRKAEQKRNKREKSYQLRVQNGEILLALDPINNRVCYGCDKEKLKTDFRGNRAKCLECERADGRTYRQGETGKEKAVQWVENNQERMTQLQATWYQENKEKNKCKIYRKISFRSYIQT